MKCCGKDVETPYCPLCSSEQRSAGLSLQNYLRKRINELKRHHTVIAHYCEEETKAKHKQELEQLEGWIRWTTTAITKAEIDSENLPTYKCLCGSNNHRAADTSCWQCGAPCPVQVTVMPT